MPSTSIFQSSIFGAPTRLEPTTHRVARRYWSSAPHADLRMVRSHIGHYNQHAMGSLVRTLNDHLKSEPEPPDLRPSSNVDFPVAWMTGPATDPSLPGNLAQQPCSAAVSLEAALEAAGQPIIPNRPARQFIARHCDF
jgi:hypothetical protein